MRSGCSRRHTPKETPRGERMGGPSVIPALPRVLLFDLGGVVVENVGFARLRELVPDRDTDALKDAWLASPAVRDFERGRIAPEAFGERFVREWSLELSPAEFLAEFEGWVRDAYPGAEEALAALRASHTVACLSNSNVLHWSRRLARLAPSFDRMISSHETGVVKPDPESFHAALDALDAAPGEVAFFDDSRRNVEVARSLGLRAHWVCGWPACEDVLRSMGVLDGIGCLACYRSPAQSTFVSSTPPGSGACKATEGEP